MNMLNLGFVFTNFNNSQLTLNALKSIEEGSIGGDYSVVVVDNDSSEIEKKILADGVGRHPNIKLIFNSENVGYFNGLNIGINFLRENKSKFQFIIVGNNDLIFQRQFFTSLELQANELMQNLVVSPDIITLDNVHQNPHVRKPVSRFREIVWDIYYSNYQIAKIISYCASKLQRWVQRKDFLTHDVPGYIHQGYGACYLLTPVFFEKFQELWSPGFLDGEEFYLSIQLESVGSMVYYCPLLKIYHHDHASTGKLSGRKFWEYKKSYHAIYRHFVSPYLFRMRKSETMDTFKHK